MIQRATVVAVTPNQTFTSAAGKSFAVTELVYKTDKGLKSQRIFDKAPFSKYVKTLSAGQVFDITLEKEGDYWQVKNVTPPTSLSESVVPATSASTASGSPVAETSKTSGRGNMPNEEIRRSVALKASVDMRLADETEDNILRRARTFEDYLAGRYNFDVADKIDEQFDTGDDNFVDPVVD